MNSSRSEWRLIDLGLASFLLGIFCIYMNKLGYSPDLVRANERQIWRNYQSIEPILDGVVRFVNAFKVPQGILSMVFGAIFVASIKRTFKIQWFLAVMFLFEPVLLIGHWQFVGITIAMLLFSSRYFLLNAAAVLAHTVLLPFFLYSYLRKYNKYIIAPLLLIGLYFLISLAPTISELLSLKDRIELYKTFIIKNLFDYNFLVKLIIEILILLYLGKYTKRNIVYALIVALCILFQFLSPFVSVRIYHLLFLYILLIEKDVVLRKYWISYHLIFAVFNLIRISPQLLLS